MQTRLICAEFLPDTEQTLADKTAKAQSLMNSHIGARPCTRPPPPNLYSKGPLHTILTKHTYRAKMSAAKCVFIIGKYTQLLASSVASEQCWQLHTSSTRDTLRGIVGGTGPLTLQTIPWCVCVHVCCAWVFNVKCPHRLRRLKILLQVTGIATYLQSLRVQNIEHVTDEVFSNAIIKSLLLLKLRVWLRHVCQNLQLFYTRD